MGLSLGAYLSHPITEKHSSNEENSKMIYGVSSMQGWRETQEVSATDFWLKSDNVKYTFIIRHTIIR